MVTASLPLPRPLPRPAIVDDVRAPVSGRLVSLGYNRHTNKVFVVVLNEHGRLVCVWFHNTEDHSRYFHLQIDGEDHGDISREELAIAHFRPFNIGLEPLCHFANGDTMVTFTIHGFTHVRLRFVRQDGSEAFLDLTGVYDGETPFATWCLITNDQMLRLSNPPNNNGEVYGLQQGHPAPAA